MSVQSPAIPTCHPSFSLGRDESFKQGGSRVYVVREGRKGEYGYYDPVRLYYQITYASVPLTLPRVHREPDRQLRAAGRSQNALTNALWPTPADSTPPTLVSLGLLPMPSLPARSNLPNDRVIPYNGLATAGEGEKASSHLFVEADVSASWTWDQTVHTSSWIRCIRLARKKAA